MCGAGQRLQQRVLRLAQEPLEITPPTPEAPGLKCSTMRAVPAAVFPSTPLRLISGAVSVHAAAQPSAPLLGFHPLVFPAHAYYERASNDRGSSPVFLSTVLVNMLMRGGVFRRW